MAKKVKSMIKLQITAAKATPAPPIGPALGQHGVNIPGFCKEFNERAPKDAGMIVPVVVTVYTDNTFCSDQEGTQPPDRFRPPQPRQGWQAHHGAGSQDCRDQEARCKRDRYRIHHEHGKGYRSLHGHHG